MSQLKVAVIGVGALGRHHARILSKMDGVSLVAVADPHETQGKTVAHDCHCEYTADYRELFDKIDAVSIVVPTFLHHRIAREFLEKDIDVLVEKPLTADKASAEELVQLADSRRRILQTGHVERFNPAFTTLQQLIKAKPRYISTQRLAPFSFRSTDISVVFDLMIHDIDLCMCLTKSPVVTVKAFGFSLMGDHYDTAQARLWFANGSIADLSVSRVNPEAVRKIQVWTQKECLDVNMHDRTIRHFQPTEELTHGTKPVVLAQQPGANIAELKEQVFGRFIQKDEFTVAAADALTLELQEFVQCVTQRQRPGADGHAALEAVKIAEIVESSIAQHSWAAWDEKPAPLRIYKAA